MIKILYYLFPLTLESRRVKYLPGQMLSSTSSWNTVISHVNFGLGLTHYRQEPHRDLALAGARAI